MQFSSPLQTSCKGVTSLKLSHKDKLALWATSEAAKKKKKLSVATAAKSKSSSAKDFLKLARKDNGDEVRTVLYCAICCVRTVHRDREKERKEDNVRVCACLHKLGAGLYLLPSRAAASSWLLLHTHTVCCPQKGRICASFKEDGPEEFFLKLGTMTGLIEDAALFKERLKASGPIFRKKRLWKDKASE